MTRRKQRLEIHLDAPLIAWIKLEAKRRGISLGEIIRAAIRKLMDEGR